MLTLQNVKFEMSEYSNMTNIKMLLFENGTEPPLTLDMNAFLFSYQPICFYYVSTAHTLIDY